MGLALRYPLEVRLRGFGRVGDEVGLHLIELRGISPTQPAVSGLDTCDPALLNSAPAWDMGRGCSKGIVRPPTPSYFSTPLLNPPLTPAPSLMGHGGGRSSWRGRIVVVGGRRGGSGVVEVIVGLRLPIVHVPVGFATLGLLKGGGLKGP